MKYNKVTLRREIFKSDALRIINWLEDKIVNQYLNERQNVCKSIRDIIHRINMPILTHLFNKDGSFFMITIGKEETIGFLRLIPKKDIVEMVVVIGDREKWGRGLGSNAILEGLKHSFFSWKVDNVIAKINFKNNRSKRAFKKVGFVEEKELCREIQYNISIKNFLKSSYLY